MQAAMLMLKMPSGLAVNAKMGPDKHTLLQASADIGMVDVAKALLLGWKEIDVIASDMRRRTALILAAGGGLTNVCYHPSLREQRFQETALELVRVTRTDVNAEDED